ncbi:MAG: glycoside hydrolase family 2 TIM barrel-domain containing protein [Lachnospiraceae bacterium]
MLLTCDFCILRYKKEFVKKFFKKICNCSEPSRFAQKFEGTNSSAVLFVNGKKAASHDGGYSTWRANITQFLKAGNGMDENEILVAVDNTPNDHVYPQKADFTFYGGIYRNVNLLCVGSVRFDLDHYGDCGVKITPGITGKDAVVTAEVSLCGISGQEIVTYQIYDGETIVAETSRSSDTTSAELLIKNVHLWNGRKDPYLYTMCIRILKDGELCDERRIPFGCRTFEISPDKGFILNGESYPLRGVSRHQDRPGIGNALLPAHHEEDMDLICELGATTIRLAHYQHDQYFYDLCDERGMVVWAEIPYISRHLPNGRENTLLQMRELIFQNYNHPSIVVWGLSNEITMGGVSDEPLLENHRALNDLAHTLDPTRQTTQAVITMCSMDEEYVHIPDVVSYNHYFGWYGGDTSMNGTFMDTFHKKYPDKPIGMSEYGCEALNWHSSEPVQGDYTEEYQAYYHEELIKQLFTRPYIWATHVWNMFDFAADARSEGGEDGMNHKGLVTFDRKYKKDAFYAYKAWLSDEPFVHLCGKRYVDRVEDMTKVTVYSNLPEVELLVNGVSLEKQKSDNHFFYFSVPNRGTSRLTAKAGSCIDTGTIRKVDTFNEDYRMKEKGDVINWFEITTPKGYYSINDKLGEILESRKGARFIKFTMAKMLIRMKLNSRKNPQPKDKSRKIDLNNPEMKTFLYGMSVKRLISMAGTMGPGLEFKKADVLKINRRLNRIKKERR